MIHAAPSDIWRLRWAIELSRLVVFHRTGMGRFERSKVEAGLLLGYVPGGHRRGWRAANRRNQAAALWPKSLPANLPSAAEHFEAIYIRTAMLIAVVPILDVHPVERVLQFGFAPSPESVMDSLGMLMAYVAVDGVDRSIYRDFHAVSHFRSPAHAQALGLTTTY